VSGALRGSSSTNLDACSRVRTSPCACASSSAPRFEERLVPRALRPALKRNARPPRTASLARFPSRRSPARRRSSCSSARIAAFWPARKRGIPGRRRAPRACGRRGARGIASSLALGERGELHSGFTILPTWLEVRTERIAREHRRVTRRVPRRSGHAREVLVENAARAVRGRCSSQASYSARSIASQSLADPQRQRASFARAAVISRSRSSMRARRPHSRGRPEIAVGSRARPRASFAGELRSPADLDVPASGRARGYLQANR
jgi:hypothetical protein